MLEIHISENSSDEDLKLCFKIDFPAGDRITALKEMLKKICS